MEIDGADVLKLAAEVIERKKEEGCTECRHLEKPDRRGIRFCDEQGVYDPARKCIFFQRKGGRNVT